MLLDEGVLEAFVLDLRLVEGGNRVQGSVEYDLAKVLEQLRHILAPDLVVGRGDQVPQDAQAPRKVGGLLDQVQQHCVEQEALGQAEDPVAPDRATEGSAAQLEQIWA